MVLLSGGIYYNLSFGTILVLPSGCKCRNYFANSTTVRDAFWCQLMELFFEICFEVLPSGGNIWNNFSKLSDTYDFELVACKQKSPI